MSRQNRNLNLNRARRLVPVLALSLIVLSACADESSSGGATANNGGNEVNSGTNNGGTETNNSNNTNNGGENPTNNANNASNQGTACVDADGDGFGEGCTAGVDCDDTRRSVNSAAEEVCDGLDNNCDGTVDPECPCFQGEQTSCYDGDDGTLRIGPCRGGVKTCDQGVWGECVGQVIPGEETCNGEDDNCDGTVDEGLTNACGVCGASLSEVCGDGLDNNCDGVIDEAEQGCNCDGREHQPCYGGPPQTLGQGICQGGFNDCEGLDWGACVGQVLPQEEICNDLDDDCDGAVDEGARNACGVCGVTEVPLELCDGEDNDCDGLVDEGLVNACGNCVGDVPNEVCGNGLDDDCDGVVDEGCTCVGDETCYSGPPGTDGVGACRVGTRECDGEFWRACVGDITPLPETCDAVDNDCDGIVDEGPDGCSICGPGDEICDGVDNDCDHLVDEHVTNLCGTCELGLPEEICGNGIDDNCNGLQDEGLLNACGTCGDTCYLQGYADDGVEGGTFGAEGTIDGLDLGTEDDPGLRLGTSTLTLPYLWVANSADDTVSQIDTQTNMEVGRYNVGDNPSRTAVDLDGNVWVANRNSANVNRIRIFDCVGNACVDPPIAVGAGPRGLAVDANNNVWVGSYTDKNVKRINHETMAVDITVDTPGNVYGQAIDSEGILWTSERGGGVVSKIDVENGSLLQTYTPSFGRSLYGIAIDAEGNVWLGNYDQHNLMKFNPRTEEWTAYRDPAANLTRGVAIDGDGFVWAANSGSNNVSKFRAIDGQLMGTYPVGAGPIGIAVDSNGNIWAVNNGSNNTTKLAPDGASMATTGVGSAPYSYSDMTGFQLRNFTARNGTWETVFDCGYVGCTFDSLDWDSETPMGTSLVLRARSSTDATNWSAWSADSAIAPATLRLPVGRYLNVVAELNTTVNENTPVLRSVDIGWQRP